MGVICAIDFELKRFGFRNALNGIRCCEWMCVGEGGGNLLWIWSDLFMNNTAANLYPMRWRHSQPCRVFVNRMEKCRDIYVVSGVGGNWRDLEFRRPLALNRGLRVSELEWQWWWWWWYCWYQPHWWRRVRGRRISCNWDLLLLLNGGRIAVLIKLGELQLNHVLNTRLSRI